MSGRKKLKGFKMKLSVPAKKGRSIKVPGRKASGLSKAVATAASSATEALARKKLNALVKGTKSKKTRFQIEKVGCNHRQTCACSPYSLLWLPRCLVGRGAAFPNHRKPVNGVNERRSLQQLPSFKSLQPPSRKALRLQAQPSSEAACRAEAPARARLEAAWMCQGVSTSCSPNEAVACVALALHPPPA